MKSPLSYPRGFRELGSDESYSCNGGGFAYDAGKFMRLLTSYGSPLAMCSTINQMIAMKVAEEFI